MTLQREPSSGSLELALSQVVLVPPPWQGVTSSERTCGRTWCKEELLVLVAQSGGAACSWGPITQGGCKSLPLKMSPAGRSVWEAALSGSDTCPVLDPLRPGVLWLPMGTCQPLSKAVSPCQAAKWHCLVCPVTGRSRALGSQLGSDAISRPGLLPS